MTPGASDADLLRIALGAFSDTQKPIGVAVSGGSDSLASLYLMVQAGLNVHAASVDHGLRPEAATEVRFVADTCARLGVPHRTLTWQRDGASGNLQDQARRARYSLLADWARGAGIGNVVVGHTADDQAETVLMGLARGAGVDGLSGMRRAWQTDGVTFHRPFLEVPRADLRRFLTRQGIGWIDDPSNMQDRFARVRARRALEALAPLGISVASLGQVAAHLAAAQATLRDITTDAARTCMTEAAGALSIDRAAFATHPPDVQRRLARAVVLWLSGADYAPRAAAVARVQAAILAAQDATLWGCRFRATGATTRATREPKALAGVHAPTDQPWDRRWTVIGPHSQNLQVRALGAQGLRSLAQWRATGLPRDVLMVTPAVWQEDALIAAPVAGYPNGWSATIAASFSQFLVSH